MDVSRKTLEMIFGKEMVEKHQDEVIQQIIADPEGYRQKVEKVQKHSEFENRDLCEACGGRCCKTAPCHYSPRDFADLSYKGLKKLLKKKGYISVVRFADSLTTETARSIGFMTAEFFVLRVRSRETKIAVNSADIFKGDWCSMLSSYGCMLSYDERPYGGKMLIPLEGRKCEQKYTIEECVKDWIPYQKVLKKVFKYFKLRQDYIDYVHPKRT